MKEKEEGEGDDEVFITNLDDNITHVLTLKDLDFLPPML